MRANTAVKFIAFVVAAGLHQGVLHPQAATPPRTPVMATSVAGSDIGDRVNHALKACALQCTVYIPPGTTLLRRHPTTTESLRQIQAER